METVCQLQGGAGILLIEGMAVSVDPVRLVNTGCIHVSIVVTCKA